MIRGNDDGSGDDNDMTNNDNVVAADDNGR